MLLVPMNDSYPVPTTDLADPSISTEYTNEIDGPDENTKLVGMRLSKFDQELRKRLTMEGYLRLIQSDGWKVDDMVLTEVYGVRLPEPMSVVDEFHRSKKEADPQPDPISESLPDPITTDNLKGMREFPVSNRESEQPMIWIKPAPKTWFERNPWFAQHLLKVVFFGILGIISGIWALFSKNADSDSQ